MGAALMVTRTDHTAAELRAVSAGCSDGAQVRRMLALALVMEGHSWSGAAALNGMDRQILGNWVHRYNVEGVDGLKSRKSPGREPFLTEQKKAELRELVVRGPDPTIHKVVRCGVRICKRKWHAAGWWKCMKAPSGNSLANSA